MLTALAETHEQGKRMVSICTGSFALAAAGALDGLRATTRWQYVDEFDRDFPAVSVDRDVLYVDEGNVLTSAGVYCGIGLCLHIVRRDLGAVVANRIARGLVTAPHREGGQAQYVPAPSQIWKARATYRGERLARSARLSTDRSASGCSVIHYRTARTSPMRP